MKKILAVAFVLLCSIALGEGSKRGQIYCPIMVDTEVDEEEFVVYKGVKVLVCCGTCKKMWVQNSDYFAVVGVKQAPQLEKVASKTIKPMKQLFCLVYTDTRVHPNSLSMEYKGNKIYFCKQRALNRFKANPDKYYEE